MVDRGNVDKHRISIAGVGKVSETQKWGRDTAISRYGKLDQVDMKPKDQSAPQRLGDPNNQRGPGWQDDHPKDWVRGFGKSGAEDGRPPNFDPGYKGKRK